MGVVITHGTVDLAQQLGFPDLFYLATQTVNDVRQLFAHGRGRGRLAVSARQHRLFGVVMRKLRQLVDNAVHGR